MRVSILDREVLESVTPSDALVYLRWLGWREKQRVSNLVSVWTPPTSSASLVARVPLDSTFDDYPQRIGELLQTLETATNIPQLDLLNRIAAGNTDVLEVKKDTPSVENGTIPIKEAREMVQHGYNLFLAGASSAAEGRPAYFSRKPERATEFMDEVRMGQTKRGSFILTFLAPVPPVELLSSPDRDTDLTVPFARKVTECLAHSLQVVQSLGEATLRGSDYRGFREGVSEGVSANLCEAVLGLQEAGGNGPVEFSFDWSLGRPTPATAPRQIAVTPEIAPVLRTAAKFLRANVSESIELRGFLLRLSRYRTNQEGTYATIQTYVDGSWRPVRFHLHAEEAAVALNAYKNYRAVTVIGVLRRRGAVWTLQSPQDFRILPASEYDAGDSTTQSTEDLTVYSRQPVLPIFD